MPHTTLTVGNGDPAQLITRLVSLVDESDATVVVVGMPLSLDGRRGPAAEAAAAAADQIRHALAPRSVTVEVTDERFTTVSAHQALAASGLGSRKRRRVVDQAAAVVLLQAWLDGHRTG